ncbi:MAG: TolC family outer membrane protein [Hyphomicrobiales bacterium]|nr:TolC family outer membrane protein [Hyphomicrobiales bacterium]
MLRTLVDAIGARLAGICIAVGLCGIGPASADTLTEALASAYWTNPDINVARAQARIADENLPIAKSALRPNVSGEGLITGTTRDGFPGGAGNNDTTDGAVGLRVSQNLFRGFRTKNARLEADASILASRQSLLGTVQNVLFDAAQAYMNVLRDQALLELRRTNVRFLNEQLKAAQDRFDVGENTRTDVAQTRARLSGAQANVSLAEANLKSSRAVYRQVIGKEPGKLARGFSFKRLLPGSLAGALDSGQSRHPAILAAIYNADAAAFAVKQVEGELLPTVSVEGRADHTFGIDSSNYSNSASITGRVNIPLYQGGGVSARVRQAKETQGLRQIEVDVRRDQVRAAVVSSWGQLDAAKASIIAASAQVEASRIALNGVQEEQRVGQRTTLDVLDAQEELVDARANLVVAQRDSIVASFALLSSAGLLSAENLNLPVELHDPVAHYDAVKDKWFGLRTPDGR